MRPADPPDTDDRHVRRRVHALLRAVKIAQALSEEAANLAYRECSSLRTLQVTRCLEDAQQQVSAFALTIDNVGVRDANSSYVWIKVFVNNPGNAPYTADSKPAGVNPSGSCRGRDLSSNTRPVQCGSAGSLRNGGYCPERPGRGCRRCRLRSLLRNRADRQALRLLTGNRHHHERPGVLQRHNHYLTRLPWQFERGRNEERISFS